MTNKFARFPNAVRSGLVFSFFLLLSGCWSFASYKTPTTGPQAAIDFQYVGSDPMIGAGLRRISIAEAKGCMNRRWHHSRNATSVPAGIPLYIIQEYSSVLGGGCSIAYNFTPQEGRKYVSEFLYGNPQCHLRLLQVMPDGTSVVDTSAVPFKSFCPGT